MTLPAGQGMVDAPLVAAALVAVGGQIGARYWRRRSSRVYFVAQLLVFTLLTVLMMAGGVVPYHAGEVSGPTYKRLLAAALEIAWWLAGAWFAAGFLRAFVVLRRQPRQAKLVQDLGAALIYALAIVAIVGYVFGLPVKGLLATSGVAAIVLGLALQSSLGDVFSGIVLNIERPYQIGDWVLLGDDVQGKVIETNWRATHFLTPNQDVAIIPNSIIAKSRVVNCSSPTRIHGATLRVKLEPLSTPGAGRKLLNEVLLGSAHVLRTPPPSVTIKDISAEMVDYEIFYAVADIAEVDAAQCELFDLIYRAVSNAGGRFSPRLAGAPAPPAEEEGKLAAPERLLAGVSLFSSLTADEAEALAAQMKRKVYRPGDLIVKADTVLQALNVVAYGFMSASAEENGRRTEVLRLAPGDYFGELGLLAGEAWRGEIIAITRVVINEIAKDALSPLLKARPAMVEELSESLARRRASRHTALAQHPRAEPQHEEGLAERVAANIRRLFSLHASADAAAPAAATPSSAKTQTSPGSALG